MGRKQTEARVLLYLGAGASCFADYHTFVTFPELLFNANLRAENNMPPLAQNAERILSAIRESLRRNNKATTHDNFLWRLDGYTQFLRLNQCDDALQGFLRNNTRLYDLHICTEQAVNQISATTIKHYSLNQVLRAKAKQNKIYDDMKRVYNLYTQIAFLNGDPPWLPIFTTNYDMLLEDIVSEFSANSYTGIPLINGIDGLTTEEAAWDPSLYNCHRKNPEGFYLWRLHGCVCWFYDEARSEICFRRRNTGDLEKVRLCTMYPGNETEYVGNDPYGFAFRSLFSHLQKCELIVFIGFSFRDDDVMHVLLKALDERRGRLKILIVDPLYTHYDVYGNLKSAASRTPMPYRLPIDKNMHSIQMSFGERDDLDKMILDKCKDIL